MRAASGLAEESPPPPALKGITNRMGRFGQAPCARLGLPMKGSPSARVSPVRLVIFLICFSSLFVANLCDSTFFP